MPPAYHIEEIVHQDACSVVYRAVDVASGQFVALTRFFPFGPDGGGLEPDEQSAYQTALSRLAAIAHPSLRPILGGGCDPVDGIPYIVTLWMDGLTLTDAVANGEPDPQFAMEWLMQALEVSELLSHVLTRQAIWVETNPTAVLIFSEGEGYRASYRISPLKWLSENQEASLQPIVELTESIMGWQGQTVNDHAGRGLGGWLRWLRATPPDTSLQEIRETLAASVGIEPPPPTSKLVKHAIVAGHQNKHRRAPIKLNSQSASSRGPAISVALLLLSTIGLGMWLYFRQAPVAAPNPLPRIVTITQSGQAPADDSIPEDELPEETPEILSETEETSPSAAEGSYAPPSDSPVYSVNDAPALMEKHGQIVSLEATLTSIEETSGKGLILYFAPKKLNKTPRCYISPRNATGKLSLPSLKAMLGKKIQIHGKVSANQKKGRPDIQIFNPQSLQLVE